MFTSRFFWSIVQHKSKGVDFIYAAKKSPGAPRRGILPKGYINMYRGLLFTLQLFS